MQSTLTLTEPETFELRYDHAANLLRGHWPRPVIDAELRGHYAELLAQARQAGSCRYWLLDLRGRNWHMPAFGRWFGTEYAAALHAALGRPVFIAYLLSPRHQAVAEAVRVQNTQCGCATHDVYPYFFSDERAALDWLRHQQGFDAAA